MRLRFLQRSKDLLPRHAGKTLEKICNGVAGLQMVKKTLDRYPGPGKDRLASENFRISRNDFLHANTSGGRNPLRGKVPAQTVPLGVRSTQLNLF